MSYFRRPPMAGDGPITSPSQVDDTIDAGTVGPTRVECSALPADSPWRRPGQVCAAAADTPSPLDFISSEIDKAIDQARAAAGAGGGGVPTWIMLAAAGGAAYLLMRKKKRG